MDNNIVYLKYPTIDCLVECCQFIGSPFLFKYKKNNESIVTDGKYGPDGYTCVTTNYRVLLENNWLDDLKYKCRKTKYHK